MTGVNVVATIKMRMCTVGRMLVEMIVVRITATITIVVEWTMVIISGTA